MKWRFSNIVGSTRVSRVQFGVPPNCGRERKFAFYRVLSQRLKVSPVSGETPEATRQRRVLPIAIKSFLH